MGNNVLLEARDLGFTYPRGTETVFTGASFLIYAGDKTALLGDNGSGKSTLLRLAAGELEPCAGRLHNRRASVFLLKQEDTAAGGQSALAWLLGCGGAGAAFERMEAAGKRGDAEAAAEAGAEFAGAGGWEAAARITAEAAALGFGARDLERPVDTFSGGERKMLALMAGFLRGPDLCLLDEPTNYLDAAAMGRLAAAVRAFRGACVVVSHDRAFLDSCVTKVFELKRSSFGVYSGNYTAYALEKDAEFALATRKKKKIEGEIVSLKEIEHNYREWGAAKERSKIGCKGDKGFIGACAARLQKKAARAAERARAKIEELEREKPFVEKVRHAALPAAAGAYLEASGLRKSLGDRTLFSDLSFFLKSGESLCLEGGNGAGKTTLMRLLAGELTPDAGEIRRSGAARLFYMPQFRPPAAMGFKGADYFHGAALQAACTMLDQLGAKGELMFTPLERLSEGQRRKVELARFLVYGADIALLDEPTTHQDIRSVRVLEEALAGFGGILVLISHDAAFRKNLPGRTIAM